MKEIESCACLNAIVAKFDNEDRTLSGIDGYSKIFYEITYLTTLL